MKRTLRILATLALCTVGALAGTRATERDLGGAMPDDPLTSGQENTAAAPELLAGLYDAADGRWFSGVYCAAVLGCF